MATTTTTTPSHVLVGGYEDDGSGAGSLLVLPVVSSSSSSSACLTVPSDAVAASLPVSRASFIAMHPSGTHGWCVSEVDEFEGDATTGGIMSFSLDTSTTPPAVAVTSQQPTGGQTPCHISLHPNGKFLLVSNYSDSSSKGSVASLPVNDDGTLGPPVSVLGNDGSGPNADRQLGPHAHSSIVHPSDPKYVYSADLGTDEVLQMVWDDKTGELTRNPAGGSLKLAPGSGPRHMRFHPTKGLLFVLTELDNTMAVCSVNDADGTLSLEKVVPALPDGFDASGGWSGFAGASYAAELVFHPSGAVLFSSNRGHDSITVFNLDPASGMPTPAAHIPCGGQTPRNFTVSPGGESLLVATQHGKSIVSFSVDPATGAVDPTPVATCSGPLATCSPVYLVLQ